ncbi:sensor histidine kinase [Winogradskyella bathintestinalis]|uniref:histidine kinase n=1 Tax=Winogradskyella bathintestinalis TaxID=3035208 RepID=A0ABT7ZQG7_9FLAO|nr:ATP-binding protein [Winogradskyella bathintestinalis]MDN3491250.1 ATP-binding protein [Winogradskyella bathintestinalis]
MSTLLKRQIKKFLRKDIAENQLLEEFLDAVSRSYTNFEEQYAMQQLAMSISSEELFAANKRLRKEAKSQKQVIDKLKRVAQTISNPPQDARILNEAEVELDELKLLELIENQTQEIIKINKQRETLLTELEHQNQELSDYAHMVSHDLKSPLRSIETLTTWLSEDYKGSFDANGDKTLGLIKTNVEKMDGLINGILEYSTIGKNKIDAYDVDLNNLIDNILSIIHVPSNVTVKRLNLPTINGDKYRLQQLFQNLIANAIKYNDKELGRIEIGYEDKNQFWQFYIKDNGIGIEEVYFDKIFQTFQKLENSIESTGIGLSIVKKIVDIYGGEIWLTSKIGEGTTFYFTIKK